MAGNHHNMTSGHLKCNNPLIWLQNLQKCEMSKTHIFLQVHSHWKLQFFFFLNFQKPLKWQEIFIIRHQDTWNVTIHSFGCKICKSVKCPKADIFLQVRSHRKHHFFFLTSGHLKCNNTLIWLQNLQTCEKSKNIIFLRVRSHRKLHFFIFSKPLKMAGNHHNTTSGHLNFNNSLIWLQNLQTYEKSKKSHFSAVHGHRKLQFFF